MEEKNLGKQIAEKLRQIRDFTAQLPAGAKMERGSLVYTELLLSAEAVAEQEGETLELEGLYIAYNDPAGPPITAEDRMGVEQDPMVMQLANQFFAIRQELDVLLMKFGNDHLQVREIRQRNDVVEEQLDRLRDQKLTELIDHRREAIETAWHNSRNKLVALRENKLEAEASQSDLDRKMAELERETK